MKEAEGSSEDEDPEDGHGPTHFGQSSRNGGVRSHSGRGDEEQEKDAEERHERADGEIDASGDNDDADANAEDAVDADGAGDVFQVVGGEELAAEEAIDAVLDRSDGGDRDEDEEQAEHTGFPAVAAGVTEDGIGHEWRELGFRQLRFWSVQRRGA